MNFADTLTKEAIQSLIDAGYKFHYTPTSGQLELSDTRSLSFCPDSGPQRVLLMKHFYVLKSDKYIALESTFGWGLNRVDTYSKAL